MLFTFTHKTYYQSVAGVEMCFVGIFFVFFLRKSFKNRFGLAVSFKNIALIFELFVL